MKFLHNYNRYIMLAFHTLTIIYIVYLISKIKYGTEIITKVTLLPYYYALGYFISKTIKMVFFCLELTIGGTAEEVWSDPNGNYIIAAIHLLDTVSNLFVVFFLESR